MELSLMVQVCEHCYHFSKALNACIRLPFKSFPMSERDYCSKWLSRKAEEEKAVTYNSPATQITNMQQALNDLNKKLDDFIEAYNWRQP